MYFSHLGVFLISVKPMTTENTENKTTPKICKITESLRTRQSKLKNVQLFWENPFWKYAKSPIWQERAR